MAAAANFILDFEHGKDVIDLRGFVSIHSFAEVSAHAIQSATGAVFDLDAAAGGPADIDVVTLQGLTPAGIGATDFLLA